MRVLVTGVSGFCGSTVARALADKGFEVMGAYLDHIAALNPKTSLREKLRE